eukprot:CAMPEP_0177166292 /NCGR_PEP_ID=MMETSP0367-20130122/7951_1 /TAXON_ID=447022 ORGANISM="Scrippsiella hangoei-like, Strain SHHI-4" /NCGR_SAMPLE_ID=MMETSP0367 /ASSEMBLY_ACC=CAM_ASM_000362 /LENGTH=33 /DNA_ID= /DNA_START= /DNA_END= /DNA_ORIENTATION=
MSTLHQRCGETIPHDARDNQLHVAEPKAGLVPT